MLHSMGFQRIRHGLATEQQTAKCLVEFSSEAFRPRALLGQVFFFLNSISY